MITTQTNKQTNKQTKKQRNKQKKSKQQSILNYILFAERSVEIYTELCMYGQ